LIQDSIPDGIGALIEENVADEEPKD